jgi:hypothetical protein
VTVERLTQLQQIPGLLKQVLAEAAQSRGPEVPESIRVASEFLQSAFALGMDDLFRLIAGLSFGLAVIALLGLSRDAPAQHGSKA